MIINSCFVFCFPVFFFLFFQFCPHQLSHWVIFFVSLSVLGESGIVWKFCIFRLSLNNLNCGFAYSDTGLLPGNNCVLWSMRFGNKYFPLEF